MTRFIIIYTIGIVAAIGIVWTVGQTYIAEHDNVVTIRFVVEQNQSVSDISDNLRKEGLISSRFIFVLYSLFSGSFSNFQPGSYAISPSFTIRDVVHLLVKGPEEVRVVLYPGMTIKEMDARLAEAALIEEGDLEAVSVESYKNDFDFLKNAETLEGYLMPDTYAFYPHHSADVIVRVMLDNFWEKTHEFLDGRDDLHELVTVGSLIEKEVMFSEDKPLVASVIYNRLGIDMPLQIDASVIYGTCDGVFVGCSLTRSDFKNDSPYNLYLYKGLPPTPISNPAANSIAAALKPRQTAYMYYLSDRETNRTYFSETFDEHNDKRAYYLGL